MNRRGFFSLIGGALAATTVAPATPVVYGAGTFQIVGDQVGSVLTVTQGAGMSFSVDGRAVAESLIVFSGNTFE